jgi:hypothetical protein
MRSANAECPLSEQPTRSYVVFVDDNFHYMEEDERYRLGDYQTYAEAVQACQAIVDKFLAAEFKPGMAAEQLYARYKDFGDDPFIVPDGDKFSSWDYARRRSVEVCAGK